MLTFITSSANKLAEVERILGCSLAREAIALEEIQAIELAPVVRHKARQAYALLGRPVLVEDTGLAFTAWNGLPGALIKWFLVSLGVAGLCQLLQAARNREATATTVFAYSDGKEPRLFSGVIHGVVPDAPRGAAGFGWDAIFQPLGSNKTFAEMEPEEKDRFSMRRLALEQLRDSGLLTP
ncbi:MAG TPA: non-canonical purine NTP pyrophosphatase [Methylomirabilota bacterium]|nr:non-canonical purine NTP pyrophosphatase [Methylomirabilota bacterium]